jgi:hypothetical protein
VTTVALLSAGTADSSPQPWSFQRRDDGALTLHCSGIGLTLRLTDPEAADLRDTITAALQATEPDNEDQQ